MLSLIGTFNGAIRRKSGPGSIYQVLMGIQNQILEKYPIVNEPGYDARGLEGVEELNAKLRLLTIRHAMVDQLSAARQRSGAAHFRTQRRILRQCWAWTERRRSS